MLQSKRFITVWLLIVLSLLPILVQSAQSKTPSRPLEKVRLQLKWFNQFQFAGYYAAIEQGYFAEEGLEVEMLERNIDHSVVKQVTEGKAEFGISDAGLLSEFAKGQPIIALAAIFQHNPLVFIATQDSGIISPYEMRGKRIMVDSLNADEAPLKVLLDEAKVKESNLVLIKHSKDYSLLTRGEVDVIGAYLTDQVFYFKQHGVKINIINPQNYGIDFYGDMLFTSQREIIEHPGRAQRFLRATLKGWQYALNHEEEVIQLLVHKYHSRLSIEHLRFEAAETRKLILADTIPIGHIDLNRLKSLADSYAASGLNKALSEADLASFIYLKGTDQLNLNDAEKAWLASHPVIRVGVDRDFAPYESIDEKGNYIGMAADYLKLLQPMLGIRFEIISDRSWAEILSLAKQGQIDLLPAAVSTPERQAYLIFTNPYKAAPAVIIDNGQGEYINSLNVLNGQYVTLEKGYFMQELIEKQYPQIKLILASDTLDALNLVMDGRAKAYVGDAGSANYAIKHHGLLSLRLSGQTEFFSRHSIAISKKNPELASIITKAMASIPSEASEEIFNRWLGLHIEQGIKFDTLLKYSLMLLALLLLFVYWVVRLQREIQNRLKAERREQQRNRILQLLTEKIPLNVVLDRIARDMETIHPKMQCSILLLDEDGKHLRHAAAPSLPDFYNRAVDGLVIGAGVGSCGTAAYYSERVIVEDIDTHPWWAPFLEIARKAGLKSCWSQPIFSAQGKVLGTFAVYHQQSCRPSPAELQLIEDEARLAALAIEKTASEGRLQLAANVFTHAREGIVITDVNARILDVNETFTHITGYNRADVLGEKTSILQSGQHDKAFYHQMWCELIDEGYWAGEVWNRRKNGEIYAQMLTISAVRDISGQTQHYVAMFTDITPMKLHQKQLEYIAHFDALTSLPNRVLLADRLQQAIIQSQRHGNSLAVAYLDLDGFKSVNDNYGHDVGDDLLITIAQRMKLALREGDTLARIGGDEFVAILVDLEHPDDHVAVLERLLQASSDPLTVNSTLTHVSASIGVTIYPQDGVDADQLLRHADNAMYVAKQAGKNRYHLFDVAHDVAVTNHRESVEHIRNAFDRREFVLYYQPKVNMRTGLVVGAEALIRWQQADGSVLLPVAFLPIIEEHPLSVELGEWVIETALAQMAMWYEQGLEIPVSVNVNARHLQQENFVERLTALLAAYPTIKPNWLELEVLETSALEDVSKVSNIMHQCHEIGVRFALDDFGTGYSSLTYLKRLPAEQLKIDRSFVRDMLDDHEDLAIVEGVIGLATAFRRQVIAEGVESVTHGELLLPLGCELAQGYGIAVPMPAADFPNWMANWQPYEAWIAWQDRPLNRDDVVAVFTEVEHRQWLRIIETYLLGSPASSQPNIVHHCHFEHWQANQGLKLFGDLPEFAMVVNLHQQMHALSAELLEAHQLGNHDQVSEKLAELKSIQKNLIDKLRELVRR